VSLSAYRVKPPQLLPASPQAVPGDVPGATPGVLEAVPTFYPAGEMDWAFLYRQIQGCGFLATANTWTTTQTFNLPNNTNALVLNSSGTAPANKHVKMTLAGTWEVGTNLLNDGLDVDYYWLDKTVNVFRMRLDTDGQLSLSGFAGNSGGSYNNAVNVVFNMAARPLNGAAPVAGFGVGTLYRLPDGNGLVQSMGGLNCVLSDVTPGAFKARIDLYAAAAGAETLCFSIDPTTAQIITTDSNTASISTALTLNHVTGNASAGSGLQIVWQGKDGTATNVILARTAALATSTGFLTVDSAWVVVPKTGGTNVEVLRIRGGAGMAAVADATAVQGNVGGQAWVRGDLLVTGTGGETISITDAGTTNEPTLTTWQHRTSGTPGASFGSVLKVQADNAANALTDQLTIASGWNSPAAGAETSLAIFSIRRAGVNTEVFRLNANGNGRAQFAQELFHANASGAVGFFGVGPVTKPTVTGSRGGNAALASLLTQLAALGLITDSTS
jgi:hypothetical protein